jgi:hypothetical protein
MHCNRVRRADRIGRGAVLGVRRRAHTQILADRRCDVGEIAFPLPVAFQDHPRAGLHGKKAFVEIEGLLAEVGPVIERPRLLNTFRHCPAIALERLQLLRARSLSARNPEGVERIFPAIFVIANKAAFVVDDEFCIVDQRQPASGRIAEQLIAQPAHYAGNHL